MLELHTAVQYVKGVGPRIADLLAEKGIVTVEDLLYYLPFRYEDRINPRSIAELRPGEMASLITEVRNSGVFRTRTMPLFQLVVGQGTASIRCVWFRGTYLEGKFKPGQVVALYGKVEQDERGRRAYYIRQPEFEILSDPDKPSEAAAADSFEIGRIVPVYEATGRLTSRWFRRVIHGTLENLDKNIPDAIPAAIRQRLRLIPRREAFCKVHWPEADEPFADLERSRTPAHLRLIFEELFFLELGLELKRRHVRAQPGIAFKADERAREMIKKVLPFHPTTAQKRVVKEIADDMRRPSPMRRLLQGDVGSGKTIVAFQAAILAIENGYQVALMAPTEILATQHYLSARRILESAGYRIVLLTGSLEQDRKRDIRRHIREGNAQLVIGTHALIQETVEFANLGLVIVDEQHRFGVMQRFKLMKKPSEAAPLAEQTQQRDSLEPAATAPGNSSRSSTLAASIGAPLEPDTLVMTATPIPRTLALTLYGDLDVSTIDELPPGRTPIVTRRVGDERADEVWRFVRKQVAAGHQAYVVYPLIEEQNPEVGEEEAPLADTQTSKRVPHTPLPFAGVGTNTKKKTGARQTSIWSGLKAAVKMHDELRKKVFPDLRIGLLHGRMDADEKDRVMRMFQRGEIDVLVSTTVIEVGVDVPNASVMVVEHAERFGLSQLHQLRGRIGRGAAKSYCILMTGGKISPEGERRLDAMVHTTDGFQIAELDLELRGPGEFFGTRQAGIPDFRVANLIRDLDLLQLAKNEAAAALGGGVSQEELRTALMHVRSHWQRRYGLVEVG